MPKSLKHTIIFLILSFIWTWFFYFTIIFMGLSPYQGVGMVLLICGGCSPTFAGIIMAMVTYKKMQRLEYIKRVYQARRIKLFWWFFIVLIFPAIFAVSIGFDIALGGSLPQMTNLKAILASPLTFFPLIFLSFMSGPFSEELGWRGFALDPLLDSFGFTKTSIIMGLIWAVWHLPLYFMPQTWHGQMGFQFTGFWMFILMTIGLTSIMSFVYVKTNRSILSAMLMHLFSNFTSQSFSLYSYNVELFRGILVFAVGAVICIYMIRTKRDAAIHYTFSYEI